MGQFESRGAQKNPRGRVRRDPDRSSSPSVVGPQANAMAVVQLAALDPYSLTPADLMQMQRMIGNQAVGQLMAGLDPVQAQPEKELDEEPVQMKPNNTGMPDHLKAGVEKNDQYIPAGFPLIDNRINDTKPIVQKMSTSKAKEKLKPKFITEDSPSVFVEFCKALPTLGFTSDIPDRLVEKLSDSDIPHYYLPTTKDIWVAFIQKIMKYEKTPLSVGDLPKVDLKEQPSDKDVNEQRAKVLKLVGDNDQKILKQKESLLSLEKTQTRYDKIKPLGQKILAAELTCNFALDTLFKYSAPQILNAFEIKKKLGVSVQNIQGGLESQRLEKELELFKIEEDIIEPRQRPRYAAINFHGHEYGAAARNDYGMCYMVLNEEVKKNATFTRGDTFDTSSAFRLNKDGVEAMLIELANDPYAPDKELDKLLSDDEYKPGDVYFDTQIHQDLDIRKDVKEIVISTVEMKLFNLDLPLIDKLISNLTGGIFVRKI
jgi:hypothetical protein